MHLFNLTFLQSLPAKFHLFLLSLSLFVHFIVFTLSGAVVVQQLPPPVTSVIAVNATSTATSTLVAKPIATSTKTAKIVTNTPTLPIQKQTAIKVAPPVSTSSVSQLPKTLDTASTQATTAVIESLNSSARAALVNILCTTVAGGSFNPISGSGVIVDSRGIILTNAHVAQYFLLKDFPFANNIQCVIRSGSPAQPLYTAEVMYLPPEWVAANAKELIAQHAQGTGENDYAFLRITGTVSSSVTMPAVFPYVAMTSETPQEKAPVLLVAYPAGLLSGETIQMNLYSSSAVSTVQGLYSFDGLQHVDLISLAGTVVSQTGSSGGILMGLGSKKLLGIIATETTGTTTSDRQLNAVTMSFIDRSLAKSDLGGILSFLENDPAQKAANFNANIAPQEISQLTGVLKKVSN